MPYVFGRGPVVVNDPNTDQSIIVRPNDIWDADDPFVQANPAYFAKDPDEAVINRTFRRTEATVETATAAPGERRTTKRG
jgi:hypothetical protein